MFDDVTVFVAQTAKVVGHTLGTLRSKEKKHSFKKPSNNFARASHFLYISLPFLHDYNVKMPNFAFPGEHKQATTKFYFSFGTWIWSLGIQLQKGLLTFDKVSR